MLNWDALITAGAGQSTPEVSHPVPVESASVPPQVGQAKANNGKASSGFFASVPVVPLKKQGKGNEQEEIAGAAAMPQTFRAEVREKGIDSYQAYPAAVLLVLAWSQHKQITKDERAGLLLDLENLPPADQVKHWHGVCVRDGLKPWQVLCMPAPMSGDDCTMCKHLTTRHEALGDDRQRYHWACSLGYLILEHGRGTERIWIAPTECKSWERWYPAEWR